MSRQPLSTEYRLAELERRQENLLRVATIFEVDHDAARVRVRDGDFESAPVPWLSHRAAGAAADWDPPRLGERCLVVSPSGDPGNAVALPGLYCDAFPPPSNAPGDTFRQHGDGSVEGYDSELGHRFIDVREDGSFGLSVDSTRVTGTPQQIVVAQGTAQILIRDGKVTVTASDVLLNAGSVDLGGTGGQKVARVGDKVNLNTGIIMEGSNVVKAK